MSLPPGILNSGSIYTKPSSGYYSLSGVKSIVDTWMHLYKIYGGAPPPPSDHVAIIISINEFTDLQIALLGLDARPQKWEDLFKKDVN